MGILRINRTILNQLEIMIQSEHLRRINNGLSSFNMILDPSHIQKISDNQYIVIDKQYMDHIILDISFFKKNAVVNYYYEQYQNGQPIQLSAKYILLISNESQKTLEEFLV